MNPRFAIAVLPLLLASACGDGAPGNSTAAATPAAAKAPPAGQQWVDIVARTPEGGVRMGNPDAPVKLIEYGARTCPTCAKFDAEGVPALKAGMIASGRVSYEFRDYPVHGALDIGPILLGHCVDTAAFFPMLDQMMAAQPQLLAKEQEIVPEAQAMQNQPPIVLATFFAERLGYLDFVKQRGVPEAKARACLADKAALDALAKNLQIAEQFNVSGTPTFIINGTVAQGTNDWATLEPLLKAAGA